MRKKIKLLLLITVMGICVTTFGSRNSDYELVETLQGGVYSVETLIIQEGTPENGHCFRVRVDIFKTDADGNKWLTHSAHVLTGAECARNGEVLESTTYSVKDYIVSDLKPAGEAFINFFQVHTEMIPVYKAQRDIAINAARQ